jgi:sporulation protein YlmC with PRC-barrel domain
VLVLNVSAAQALQTPAFATPALFPLTWEEPVRAFWKDQVRLSGLSSACSTPSGLTHKIAYASQLLQAELRDGNGELLGQVTDAVLEPESGSIDFFVVQLANRQATVLVPLGAVNIPEEALQGGQPVWLVLLTDTARLEGAPTIDSIAAGLKIDAANTARGYWNR